MIDVTRGTRIVFSGLALLGVVSTASAAPALLWEVTGLANPESALPDLKAGVIYVSNVNGAPDKKDGNGFISKISLDGKTIDLKWSAGLNAPKGLALSGGKLYAADIDELVEIDTKDGKITNRFPAKDAKFLNDAAADATGNVYVSDMVTNTIWKLSGGTFESWLHDDKLENPNGLLVEGTDLRVAAWGVMTDGFATKVPGHLISVTLDGKAISAIGDGTVTVSWLDGGADFELSAEAVVHVTFHEPNLDLAETLSTIAPEALIIGEARTQRFLTVSIRDGFEAGRSL